MLHRLQFFQLMVLDWLNVWMIPFIFGVVISIVQHPLPFLWSFFCSLPKHTLCNAHQHLHFCLSKLNSRSWIFKNQPICSFIFRIFNLMSLKIFAGASTWQNHTAQLENEQKHMHYTAMLDPLLRMPWRNSKPRWTLMRWCNLEKGD